jgi:hypothetical protein
VLEEAALDVAMGVAEKMLSSTDGSQSGRRLGEVNE